MKKLILYSLIISFLTTCVDPIDIETPDDVNLLTVEGFITTQPGPHNVRLSITAQYGSIYQAFPQRVLGANVGVRDNEGVVTLLNEIGEGNYQTPAGFRAEVGKSYSLLIEFQGRQYISFPDKVDKAPEIEDIVYRYEEVPSDNDLLPTTGFKVFVQYEDNAEVDNYYLFDNSGAYNLSTRPDLFTVIIQGVPVPAPKDCCYECFATEIPDREVRIESDRIYNGQTISKEVAYLVDNGRRFVNNKYLFYASLLSISKDTYEYLSLIENQKSIDGDIFDPPPAQIRGNFINLADPNEQVIGHFWVADVSTDSVFVDGGQLPSPKPPNTINDDCRETEGATTAFPSWWFSDN